MAVFGLSNGTLYKMIIKSDGSPNWVGITILTITFLVIFVWRCVVFIPEYWVGVRLRYNRVVRNKDGIAVEYDPLASPGEKKRRGVRFRFYLVNSIRLVNCGDRETNLDIDAITVADHDFDTSIVVVWHVSRKPNCPSKSFLKPSESTWRWRQAKDELESLVRSRIANAILTKYSSIEGAVPDQPEPVRLPILSVSDIEEVTKLLLEDYGVEVTNVLYNKFSIAHARRDLEGRLAIARSNEKVAMAHHDVADAIRSARVDHPHSGGDNVSL